MEWHLNDLSLHGQFSDPHEFRAAFEPILKSRWKHPAMAAKLFASRSFSQRAATSSLSLQQSVLALRDQNFTRQVLEWLTKSGPFWEEDRTANPDDYFEYLGIDVTNQGLGEATRRHLAFRLAGSFSILSPNFQHSPLTVQHGLAEEPLGVIQIPNAWRIEDLEASSRPAIASWIAMLESALSDFDQLIFSRTLIEHLRKFPFNAVIAERSRELLQALQSIAIETNEDGSLTEKGHQLIQLYFHGWAPNFTDESEPNKSKFRSEMTFKNPEDPTLSLFCPWHGKIKQQQFRIHFEWPRPSGQRKIKVTYIGEHIT